MTICRSCYGTYKLLITLATESRLTHCQVEFVHNFSQIVVQKLDIVRMSVHTAGAGQSLQRYLYLLTSDKYQS